jgi:hypothetical protein
MFSYDELKPRGRNFDEYRRMFSLGDDDLSRRILGCGDGPASFNQELTARGGQRGLDRSNLSLQSRADRRSHRRNLR